MRCGVRGKPATSLCSPSRQVARQAGRGAGRPRTAAARQSRADQSALARVAGRIAYRRPAGRAARFEASDTALAHDVILSAIEPGRRGQVEAPDLLVQKQAPPVLQTAFDADHVLVDMQITLGRAEHVAGVAELGRRLIRGIGGAVVGLAAVLGMGWLLARTIRHSRRDVDAVFNSIARNDEAWVIEAAGAREFYPATPSLRAIGARRSVAQHEHFEMQRRAANARREAITEMASTIARETGGAVSQISARRDSMAREIAAMAGAAERVSANAGYVAEAANQVMTNAQLAAALTARSHAGRMTGH